MDAAAAVTPPDSGDRWSAPDGPRAEFRLLGHLEVGDGVTLQALGGPKQRALLAYLLLHAGEVVTTERLVDAVWGEEPPPTAAAVVYGYIRKLRAALEATSASLTTRSSGYVLEIPGSSLDVACFERLSGLGRQALRSGDVADARRTLGAALALWRGDALDGLDGDGFIHAERTRLESLRLATRLARIDADLRLGGAADVVGELEALVREHPLDEGIRGQLMLALYRSGNQVEALATYQDIRRALAEEVGLEPSRSLQELEVAILRHDASLDAPAAGAASRPSGEAPRAMSPGLRLVEAADACPFIGLATFGVHDAYVFFGRERLVSEMVARLAEHGFLGVVGPSGSGKSSAVRAGLVPAIEGGALGGAGWLRVILRPGPEPMRELDRVVFAALDEAQRARLPARGDPLAAATSVLPEGDRLLVVVDQFEELFTSVEDAATRAAFIAALVGAARSGAAAVVVALRADFYGRCAEAADLAELLAASQVLVGPMARDEYRAVIEGPASRAGLSVERALVERLLDEVDGRAGGLPLLSTALVELWERRDGRTIQFAALAATGGISGAVGRLAENAYGQLTDAEQEAARVVFLRLVGGGGGDVAARRRVPLAEFDVATNPVLERTLTVLTAARLLTADRGTVEVAHEALFREWPRLEGWLADDQESRRVRAHLREAAREWDGGGRPPSELYRGVRLAAVLDWTGAHDAELNELEHEFVAASHAAGQAEERRQRRANRRLRALLATALVGLMVAVAAGGAAVVQRQTADQATAEALRQQTVADTAAADAQAQRVVAQQEKSLAESAATAADAERLGAVALNAKDLDLSLLLARQAVALDDSAATRANLLADLARNPATLRVLRPVPGRPQSIFASADGSTLLTWNNGTEFAVINGASGTTRYTRTWDPSTDLVGLTSSGRVYLFSFSSPATLTILDPVTGAVQRTIALPAAVTSQTFVDVAPDLSTFVSTAASGRSLTVWNAVTVAAERTLNAPPGTDFVGVSLYSKGYLVTPLVRNGAGFAGPGELAFWSPNASTPLLRFPIRSIGDNRYSMSPTLDELAVDNLPQPGDETLLDLRTGASRPVQGQHTALVQGSAFSPDSRLLVTGGDDDVARVWDAATGQELETLQGHAGRVFAPAVAEAHGEVTAWTASLDGSIMSWDLSGDRTSTRSFSAGRGIGQGDHPHLAVSPDGRLLALAQNGGAVILDASTHVPVHSITVGSSVTQPDVAWSPDGSRLAVSGDGNDRVELFDTMTWRSVRGPLPGMLRAGGANPNEVDSLAFSVDSKLLAVGTDDGAIYRWDAKRGEPIGAPILVGGSVYGLSMNPMDGWIAAAFGSQASVYAPDGTREYTVNVDDGYGASDAVAFSPDGMTLATGGGAGDVRLWDAITGAAVGHRILVSAGWVLTIAWSSSSDTLLTAATDGTVRLADAQSGLLGATFAAQPNEHGAAAFAPDGRSVYVVYADGRGYDWSIDPATAAARACAIAGRTLTRAEWEQYLPGRPYAPACAP